MTGIRISTGFGRQLGSRRVGVLRLLAVMAERRRQRRALAELDDWLLRDIGLAPAIARTEASKPFWR